MHPAKATIVEDIAGRLNSSPFLFVADYTGLKVTQFAELRNRLFAVGAEFHVVKNTFLRRALTGAGLPEIDGLKGQSAIVTGEKDVAAAAKVVKTFAAEFKKPVLRAGIVDHLVVSSDQINAIADLPSRDVLLATLLGVLQAPGTKLVRVLNEPAASLARVLQAKVDQSGQPAETSAETSDATPEAPEAVAS
ncbi:MAG: 50S ribosomal protein L10 [Verrucomicrobiota bacterium]